VAHHIFEVQSGVGPLSEARLTLHVLQAVAQRTLIFTDDA